MGNCEMLLREKEKLCSDSTDTTFKGLLLNKKDKKENRTIQEKSYHNMTEDEDTKVMMR